MPPPGPRDVFARPRDTLRTILRVLDYFRPHAARLVLVALGLGLGTFSNVYGTYLLKPVFNDHILPLMGRPDPDFSGLVRTLLIMGGVYLAGGVGLYVYRFLMIRVSTGILLQLRREMFARMQNLPIVYFDRRTHGQSMTPLHQRRGRDARDAGARIARVRPLDPAHAGRLRDDAGVEPLADRAGRGHAGLHGLAGPLPGPAQFLLLQGAAGCPGGPERLHRGDGRGPEGGAGLQPSGHCAREFRRAQ